MRKMFSTLSRFTLILGVLVALTPCGICHGSIEKSTKACSMKSMSGKMDCCHKGKEASPLCKVMDQSSTTVVSHNQDAAPAPVVSFATPLVAFLTGGSFFNFVPSDTSPLRAPLSLRI